MEKHSEEANRPQILGPYSLGLNSIDFVTLESILIPTKRTVNELVHIKHLKKSLISGLCILATDTIITNIPLEYSIPVSVKKLGRTGQP
jgi:hypothetical protein